MLDFKLDYGAAWQTRRRQIVAHYRKAFADCDHIVLPRETHGAKHIYHKFVVRSHHRAALAAHLDQVGIETKVHYPVPLHREPTFVSNCVCDDRHYPKALHFADTVLTLPAHAFLQDGELEAIVGAVQRFMSQPQSSRNKFRVTAAE